MRHGYAIRDTHQKGWLHTRTQVEGCECPVTVWVEDEDQALQFNRLKEARAMLRIVRRFHRRPERVVILNPKWKVIA